MALAVDEGERRQLTEGAKVVRYVSMLAEKRTKRALRPMKR